MNGYELIYEYSPYILGTIVSRVEQHEKDIYHELRELNELGKTRITSGNDTWKAELRNMLSINGFQLAWEDLDGPSQDQVVRNIENTLYSAGYTAEIAKDMGTLAIIQTLQEGRFPNKSSSLTERQIEGLRKELIITIKRFAWAKELDDDAIVVNTVGFDRGAYSEGKLDIAIRLPKVHNRRQVRSEVKNYTEIFKIGTIGQKYLKPILDSVWFSRDENKNEIIFHINSLVVEECCNNFLLDKYKDWFPFIEDGNKIVLFSDFIYNVIEGDKKIQLRNYGQRILTPIQIQENEQYGKILQELRRQGHARKAMVSMLGDLKNSNYQLWYANNSK